jgi:hypothetical protein
MKDQKLLKMAKKNNYEIVVDNDSVWVLNKNGEYIDSFDKYGYHLLVEIFNYIGIDARYC